MKNDVAGIGQYSLLTASGQTEAQARPAIDEIPSGRFLSLPATVVSVIAQVGPKCAMNLLQGCGHAVMRMHMIAAYSGNTDVVEKFWDPR
jgi:hypothetical protein